MPGSSTSFTVVLHGQVAAEDDLGSVSLEENSGVNQSITTTTSLLLIVIITHNALILFNSKNEEMRCWIIVFNETHFGLFELFGG